FGFGLLLGAILMAMVFVVELAFGWITISDTFVSDPIAGFGVLFAAVLIGFVFVGIYEEILSRGYHLVNLSEGFANIKGIGPRGAIIIALTLSSLVFGLLHASNNNATLISTVNISLAGVLLALGMLLTGRLAIPIGLHITWNFFQGAVFGFPVSGTRLPASIFGIEQGGATLVTGGPFGPEAGIIGLVAMAIGTGLTLLYVQLRYGSVELHADLATPNLRSAARETPEDNAISL
ncbi:MAG: CPBP family intramembrane metalloprotease, partial [Chloroflexi bacterium]|nr:CPBP family intramembrane metalloprotease [Chloroflexota bacterium]